MNWFLIFLAASALVLWVASALAGLWADGRWVDHYKCSACGHVAFTERLLCPRCGNTGNSCRTMIARRWRSAVRWYAPWSWLNGRWETKADTKKEATS